jgi:MFS family permease
MLSLAKPDQFYQIFLAQGVGIGIAMGLLFLPPIGLIAHYFRRRRAFAMGITVSGSSVGGIILPIMLNKLFQNPSVGFAWGVRACAFLIFGCLALACVMMTPRLPNRRQREALGIVSPPLDFKGIITDTALLITIGG